MSKRLLDIVGAAVGLVLLSPLFAVIAAWIRVDSPGPTLFRQVRVGRNGRQFRIHKFRTMVVDAESIGKRLSVAGDARVTRSGVFLRRYRLDELPQLVDVLLGQMSLVGPRPEVPEYVARYPEEVRRIVLSVRPGITDRASIEFRNEADILAASPDPERTYVDVIIPKKLKYHQDYVRERTFWGDVGLIGATLAAVFGLRRESIGRERGDGVE